MQRPRLGQPRLTTDLAAAIGADAVAPESERARYATDASGLVGLPDVVVRPADTAAVAAVLAVAQAHGVAVVPMGARTGLAGGAVARGGGIALSLERLDMIAPVDRGNLRLTAGAGARTVDVHAAARAAGLFYPPDPASLESSTIGGNVATNAGGPRCFKYGVTAEYVLALEAVTAEGRIFRTGPATRKSATGTRIAQLLVGSEGTLAVVTEATLRLLPRPAARLAATASFDSVEAAGEAVAAIVADGLVPSALELLDAECLELGGLPAAAALLLVEVDGPDAASVGTQLSLVEHALRRTGARRFERARGEHDIERLWHARRALSAALTSAAAHHLFQDVCVPPAAIPEALRRIAEIAVRHRVRIPVFGHAGDGNLHPSVLYDDAGEADAAHAAEAEVLRTAVALGGTVSAEHGIGLLKVPFLAETIDPVALEVARTVKRALDPRGILNPGKLLP
ncbi:MAG: FAD-binding protein [Thermoleophilia bacterium]|nr:FAD-binding protein [Thermoleophilia bacterium]